MATARSNKDARLAAQGAVLKRWGSEWRRTNAKSQQDLGRAAGYGSDESPKSAAVAISRIESGKTDPTGRYRQRLLNALGHTEAQLHAETEHALIAASHPGKVVRTLARPIYVDHNTRRTQIIAASNLLTDRVMFQLRNYERTLERAHNMFIVPFLETAAKVDWQPLLDIQHPMPIDGKSESQEVEIRRLREQTQVRVLKALTDSPAGSIADVGIDAATAGNVLADVSAAVTASTETAIASRSGAGAANATRAWLRGGALAAQGLGVAGGTAVLAGILPLPTLLAVGSVIVWKGRQLRKEAEAETEKLDAAQQAFEDMQDVLPRSERWNDAQQAIIQRAELLGRTIRATHAASSALVRDAGAEGDSRVAWERLSHNTQEALLVELKLLSVILDIQALPVWLGLTTVSDPEPTAVQKESVTVSEDWIDESLLLAQFDLDEHEEWARDTMTHDPFSHL